MGWCFGTRPDEVLVFMDDEAEGSGEIGFESGDVDLTVALAGMSVSSLKEPPFDGDGDVEGRSGDEFLVVHVSGM